jgi:hypothetical protein
MAIKTFSTGEVLTSGDTNTYLANAGWNYITSGALSSAVNFAGCFSATYTNYRVVCTIDSHTGGAANIFAFPLSGTTPNTTAANYKSSGHEQAWGGGSTLVVFGNDGAAAGWAVGRVAGDGSSAIFYSEFLNPFASARTFYKSEYVDGAYSGRLGGLLTVTTSYDGIRFTGPTMTGTVTIYGYRKA